jgi:hypothetical protein
VASACLDLCIVRLVWSSSCCCRYYKRLEMPEMQLLQLAVEPSRVSWSHSNGVLQVHYAKPPALLAEVGCAELMP